ncbi:hypothetical protein CFC21_026683 [Triticum aestivum]|uniref:O-methyltransferase domain-containing protein n=2 Tax=Triticum aestivum TaxID=4565 RepID=A0A3B6CH12_WHEAT|nr:acetylserotonin O-methyltransferase 3-like [Triticum aestivum]KAF7012495.1 hypothetical protein CFC21_026683 [Triticum aestivum]
MAMASSAELMQAEADLVRHSLGYLKSMALHSAVKLGVADALHRCGGSASLPDLLATLPLPPSKQPYLSRLMKVLATEGIFVAEEGVAVANGGDGATCVYHLNTMSRLLVNDAGINGGSAWKLSSCILMTTTPQIVGSALQLGQWFQSDREATPFVMANGRPPYGVAAHDAEFNSAFNEAMAADSRYLADLVVRECGEVFEGITSLVDVAGGTGTMARAITKAFPHVKCSVIDLPHVIQGVSAQTDNVEFVAGDMMEFIPPADRILLKYVLHNWSDEDCVKILTRCREAIAHGEKEGKVIIIDEVVGSRSQNILEAQLLMDMQMMSLFMAKERYEQDWNKIFTEAGFVNYKIRPILGVRSVIELYI